MDGNGKSSKDGGSQGRLADDGKGAAERLRRAVAAAADGSGSRTEVQSAARGLVAEFRNRQAPPEEVLLQIKAFLAEAGLEPGAVLYRDMITWSVRYYFDER